MLEDWEQKTNQSADAVNIYVRVLLILQAEDERNHQITGLVMFDPMMKRLIQELQNTQV